MRILISLEMIWSRAQNAQRYRSKNNSECLERVYEWPCLFVKECISILSLCTIAFRHFEKFPISTHFSGKNHHETKKKYRTMELIHCVHV